MGRPQSRRYGGDMCTAKRAEILLRTWAGTGSSEQGSECLTCSFASTGESGSGLANDRANARLFCAAQRGRCRFARDCEDHEGGCIQ